MDGLRLIFVTGTSCLGGSLASAGAKTSLNPALTPFLSRYDLPALAAAVVKNGEILAAGAVGTRRVGTNIPVTVNDRFHLGSDTKAMTALLAARLVRKENFAGIQPSPPSSPN